MVHILQSKYYRTKEYAQIADIYKIRVIKMKVLVRFNEPYSKTQSEPHTDPLERLNRVLLRCSQLQCQEHQCELIKRLENDLKSVVMRAGILLAYGNEHN